MTVPAKLVEGLDAATVVTLTPDQLAELLDAATVLREVDTNLSGLLRILLLGADVLIQEQTPKGELLVRRAESAESAQAFVDGRLATYERMWDGCGCKVDYYD